MKDLVVAIAKALVDDPSKVESAASVGAEIIREYLEAQNKEDNKDRKEDLDK